MKNKFAIFFTTIVVFLSVYALVYVFHIYFLTVNVIFYSAIIDGIIASLIIILLLLWWNYHSRVFDRFSVLLILCFLLVSSYAIAISGPTVIDRSLSIYIVEKLAQRGGGIRRDALRSMFIEEFIPESRLMDVRVTEQLESATVVLQNGCVRLTNFGWTVATATRWLRLNALAKRRKLVGEYTDDLVDPFKNSPAGPIGYEC